MLSRAALLVLLLAPTLPAAAQTPAADTLAIGRQFAEWFLNGEADSLWAHTHPDMQAELSGPDELRQRTLMVLERGGGELEVVEERLVRRNGRTQYWRAGQWAAFTEDTITLRLVIVDGMLAGMGINPTSQNPPTDPPSR